MIEKHFTNMIVELEGCSNIEILDKYVGIEFDTGLLKRISERGFGMIDERLLTLQRDISMYCFYWRWKEDDRYGGEIGLVPLITTFDIKGVWDNKLWFDKEVWEGTSDPDAMDRFSRNLYCFDEMEQSMQSTRLAAFFVDRSAIDVTKAMNPDIWFWEADGPKYKLTIKYEEYLEKLLITKGFWSWQQFFMDWDGMDFDDPLVQDLFPYASPKHMEEFLEYMPKIFPDQDYTEFKLLYDNWIKKAKEKGFNV